MFSPATAECTEYIPFNIAVTVTPIEGVATNISSILISPALNETSKLRVLLGTIDVMEYQGEPYPAATNGIITFTIEGTMRDMFQRGIYYLDTNAQQQYTTKFGLMPDEFNALYKYQAPAVVFVDQMFTVTYDYEITIPGETGDPLADPPVPDTPGSTTTNTATEDFVLVVRHNWQSDHQMVATLVKAGNYYKHAKETGYAP